MTVKNLKWNRKIPFQVFFCLRCAGGDFSKRMASSLIWVLIGVYVGFFIFLQKVMKDS